MLNSYFIKMLWHRADTNVNVINAILRINVDALISDVKKRADIRCKETLLR